MPHRSEVSDPKPFRSGSSPACSWVVYRADVIQGTMTSPAESPDSGTHEIDVRDVNIMKSRQDKLRFVHVVQEG